MGLGGKGILDILIGVNKKKIAYLKCSLMKNGYTYIESAGNRERLFFERNYGLIFKRRVHLHLTWLNSNTWKNSLRFRNKLISSRSLAKKYEDIKKKAKILGLKGKHYRNYKRRFIEGVLK